MCIEILNENFKTDLLNNMYKSVEGDNTTTEYKGRFLKDIESDLINVLSRKNRDKQNQFNELIQELKNLKKPNSNLSVFSGLNVAYFFNMVLDSGKLLISYNNLSRKIRTFIKECEYLKPQYNGLEVIFKPQETEIRKIKTRVLRF